MERMTIRNSDGSVSQPTDLKWAEALDRLAAYEDTGLTPAEVSAIVKEWSDLCTIVGECDGIDRLRELAEAGKDGRLVVPPCKVGDRLYEVTGRKTISVYEVRAICVELWAFEKLRGFEVSVQL